MAWRWRDDLGLTGRWFLDPASARADAVRRERRGLPVAEADQAELLWRSLERTGYRIEEGRP
ncbi:MAG: hypothetical protein CVT80_00360 [Alphaproteobacteria bacterium HGW-Alphaproteobacteria-2]|nr:MAG: hypothetical protein CVT80_00360 [Alphaproteobacteria bacterium HGW-Alphaproteobacteria-2]